MKELTVKDLEKVDVIEITEEEYDKILKWCSRNRNLIEENKDNIKNTLDYGIIKVDLKGKRYENLFRLVCFAVIEEKVYLSYYGYTNNNKEIKNFCGGYGFFIKLEDCWKYFNEKYIDDIIFTDVPISDEFLEYMEEKHGKNSGELIADHCDIMIWTYSSILIYSQLNQEKIIKQTRTTTHKVQSKKDKREYERHTLGWNVRGHWRNYKSGKRVWIKPQIRGDKEHIEGKIYEI